MLNNIWQEDDDYYRLVPLTDKLIKKAEEQLNISLPLSYLNLLQVQNGGSITFNAFPSKVPNSWAEDHIDVDHIFGIAEEEGILNSEYLIKEWGLPDNIVLFSGDGHSWIAFDYRNVREEPPIIFVDVEMEQIINLAPDFSTFLSELYSVEAEIENVEDEETYLQPETINWNLNNIESALSTYDIPQVMLALDYLCINMKGNEGFIEQKLINLLQSSVLEIKEIAANYANHFNEMGIISSEGIENMISIIRDDKEIEYYVEMFFSDI